MGGRSWVKRPHSNWIFKALQIFILSEETKKHSSTMGHSACACVCIWLWVSVCVCVWERERENGRKNGEMDFPQTWKGYSRLNKWIALMTTNFSKKKFSKLEKKFFFQNLAKLQKLIWIIAVLHLRLEETRKLISNWWQLNKFFKMFSWSGITLDTKSCFIVICLWLHDVVVIIKISIRLAWDPTARLKTSHRFSPMSQTRDCREEVKFQSLQTKVFASNPIKIIDMGLSVFFFSLQTITTSWSSWSKPQSRKRKQGLLKTWKTLHPGLG